MRLAILSDIHGNYLAFERVLADAHAARVEQIVCLGDVALGGPAPREVIRRLRDLKCAFVMGNTDEFLFNVPTPDPMTHRHASVETPRNSQGSVTMRHSAHDLKIVDWVLGSIAQLARADLDFVKSFQPRIEIPLTPSKTLLCYHGSPQSNNDVMLATTPDENIAAMLGDYRAAIMAGGHTHTQMLRRFQQSILINPGSVGMPIQRDPSGKVHRPPFSEYAIVSAEGDHLLGVEFRRVPLDVDAVVRAIRASGLARGEELAKEWEGK